MHDTFELIIVGGGPAGLSAALAAGRARRKALLIDGGTPRNAAAHEVHTFVTRDGTPPAEFRRIAREQIARYPTVAFADGIVENIEGQAGDFQVTLRGGESAAGARILLALGLVDIFPSIPGVSEYWGRGLHHCPYCDGYELRDGAWGLLTDQPLGFEYSFLLRGWTNRLTVFTNGKPIDAEWSEKLAQAGTKVDTRPLARVTGTDRALNGIALQDGTAIALDALFLQPAQRQTVLVAKLGLAVRSDGAIERNEQGETSRPGIYAAGDCSAGPMQQAIFSAAEGGRVAFGIIPQLIRATLR